MTVPKLFRQAFVATALVTLGVPAHGADSGRASATVQAPAAVARIVQRTNEFRRESGLRVVASNEALRAAAEAFAAFMARTDKYGHEADGSEPAERAKRHGYDYCLILENIAYYRKSTGFTSDELADAVVEGWKNSPRHRRNMLDADATEIGVGIAHGTASDRWYAVQLFGLPASASVSFSITNRAEQPIRYRLGERAFDLAPRVTRTHEGCRPSALVVDWPGGQAPTDAQPKGGEHFAVVRDGDGGRWRLERR